MGVSETETAGSQEEDGSFVDSIKRDFSTETWVLIPIAIGLNSAGSFVANTLKLPLFMDNTGTFLLAIIAGPWAAALGGGLSNVLDALLGRPVTLAFIPVPVLMGLAMGYLARAGYFDTPLKVTVPAVVSTVIATVVAAPIVVYVFGGATGVGADVVTGVLTAAGQDLLEAVVTGQVFVNLVDKGGLTFVAYFIARATPPRYLPPLGQEIFSE